MSTSSKSQLADAPTHETPEEVAAIFDRLWPLLRSLTGEGVRQTHDILGELVPLDRIEIPSGTQVLDWTVPREWAVREAHVTAPGGERILDVRDNNLHLVNYATPFRGRVSRRELDAHLHSIPKLPEAIPYVTSYYEPRWGFCLSQRQRDALPEGEYEIVVDTELFDGSMTISEAVLPGAETGEVLISTYTCHPSMANNELSGPLVAAFLYRRLAAMPERRLTYRFVFAPETIGAIAYLDRMGDHLLAHMEAGFVVTCIGTEAPFTLKRSRRGDSLADRAAEQILARRPGTAPKILDFFPTGSDERQYCSPGFNLPVAMIARSLYSDYPEYHTSLDNRDFISFEAIVESVDACFDICFALDRNIRYRNTVAKGEPQLGRRGLMATLGAQRSVEDEFKAMQWLLNLADGEHDLLSIAERGGADLRLLDRLAEKCKAAGILKAMG